MIPETLPHLRALQFAAVNECEPIGLSRVAPVGSTVTEVHDRAVAARNVLHYALEIADRGGTYYQTDPYIKPARDALDALIAECEAELAKEREDG